MAAFLRGPGSMDYPRNIPERLACGSWVPPEVAAQLTASLRVRHRSAKTHGVTDRAVGLLIKIQMADLEHLLDVGDTCDLLVTADRCEHALHDVQRLTRWLTAPRSGWAPSQSQGFV